MPEMAAMGPVFRGVELRHEIDAASYQAKRIPCREPLAFSRIIDLAEGPHCAAFCHDALAWTQRDLPMLAHHLRNRAENGVRAGDFHRYRRLPEP